MATVWKPSKLKIFVKKCKYCCISLISNGIDMSTGGHKFEFSISLVSKQSKVTVNSNSQQYQNWNEFELL